MTNGIESLYKLFQEHPVISTDSRKIPPGCLFFALKGERFNGNEFALTALEQGAACAIVDEAAAAGDPRCIMTDDVLITLQQLALHHRRQFNIPIVAITGTNGKTTTKELITAVLSSHYNTTATQGNLNNHIGVPLTLLTITPQTGIAVIEMGANHPGEIDALCRIAEPTCGLITNIGKAHLEGFGGFEGVIRTKTELYRYLIERGHPIFIDHDNPLLTAHASGARQVTYGKAPAYLALQKVTASPCVEMEVQRGEELFEIRSNLYGGYNAGNILAATCVGLHFDVPIPSIIQAIAGYTPSNNRSQRKQTDSNLLILDAYNANPSSMEAALSTFAEAPYEHKMVILGDMLELGEESDAEHLRIIELAASHHFEQVYLVGPIFTRLNSLRENICFGDSEMAALWFAHEPPKNFTILIKGSRGIRLEKLTETL